VALCPRLSASGATPTGAVLQSVRAKPLRQPSLVIDVTRSATMRGLASLDHSFHEAGIMLRLSGDTIELTPP